MTNQNFDDQLRLGTLTLCVAFNKTVRANEAGEVSQPVRAKRAGAAGPDQADRTVNILNISRSS